MRSAALYATMCLFCPLPVSLISAPASTKSSTPINRRNHANAGSLSAEFSKLVSFAHILTIILTNWPLLCVQAHPDWHCFDLLRLIQLLVLFVDWQKGALIYAFNFYHLLCIIAFPRLSFLFIALCTVNKCLTSRETTELSLHATKKAQCIELKLENPVCTWMCIE